MLITSRLASLERLGTGVKVGTVAGEQARAVLENNAGTVMEGKSKATQAEMLSLVQAKQTPR